MLSRVSWFLVVFCSVLVLSHAVTFECNLLRKSGCVFKHDADGDEMLDCGNKELREAPKIDNLKCSNPKTMYLKLKQLTKHATRNIPSTLKKLHIDDSNLRSLPPDAFDHLEKLEVLSLRGNRLKTLSEIAFSKLKRLKKLDLTNNNLDCDCGLRWIKDSNIDVIGKCVQPPFFANKELKKLSSAVLCDVDECRDAANPVCGSHASCKNTPGSFDCVCDPGFYSVNEKNCADIDECSTDQHNCSIQATCANTPGGFSCTCNIGYLGNGHYCLEVTEVSMVKRLMQKSRVFSFLVKRKLVPHAVIGLAVFLVLFPAVLCLCVCCCQRKRLRKKYKGYERVSTNDAEEPRTSKQKPRLFRRRNKSPVGSRKISVRRVTADNARDVSHYEHAPLTPPGPRVPQAPSSPPSPPPSSLPQNTSAPPLPPAAPPPPPAAPPPPPPPPPSGFAPPPPPPPPPPVK